MREWPSERTQSSTRQHRLIDATVRMNLYKTSTKDIILANVIQLSRTFT